MNLIRRKIVKSTAFLSVGATLVGSGLLIPQRALGAYAMEAFEARDIDGALNASLGSSDYSPSDTIKLKAPDIAENGAVVPVTVSSSMANVDAISIIAKGDFTDNGISIFSSFLLISDII